MSGYIMFHDILCFQYAVSIRCKLFTVLYSFSSRFTHELLTLYWLYCRREEEAASISDTIYSALYSRFSHALIMLYSRFTAGEAAVRSEAR